MTNTEAENTVNGLFALISLILLCVGAIGLMGYWGCLLAGAFLFILVSWASTHRGRHGR